MTDGYRCCGLGPRCRACAKSIDGVTELESDTSTSLSESLGDPPPSDTLPPEERSSEQSVQPESETLFY